MIDIEKDKLELTCRFLANFWDWMHHEWYESGYDGCSSSRSDSFKEYVEKFLKEQKEKL